MQTDMTKKQGMRARHWWALVLITFCWPGVLLSQAPDEMKVTVSAGYTSPQSTPFFLKLLASPGMTVDKPEDWRRPAGAGHVARQTYTIGYPKAEIKQAQG